MEYQTERWIFFRAESFYKDSIGMGILASYGGKSVHAQPQGEIFLSFFSNRLE